MTGTTRLGDSYAIQRRGKPPRKAIREADRAAGHAWSLRMKGFGGPGNNEEGRQSFDILSRAFPELTIADVRSGFASNTQSARSKTQVRLNVTVLRHKRQTGILDGHHGEKRRKCGLPCEQRAGQGHQQHGRLHQIYAAGHRAGGLTTRGSGYHVWHHCRPHI